MSSSNLERKPEEGGTMIPVFTVIKNGAILKNIFVVNKPPPPSQFSGISSIKFVENSENSDHEAEEIVIVGRHPDCNIVLMHPSISRFHLQIDLNPSLRKLFVTDLSSVHGTWISEKKIDPGFLVEMKEGDTIRMGASTRVYRLHWVPLSRAYDSENPFVSESDLALIEEKEEESAEKMSQNEDLLLATENENIEEKDSLDVLEKAEDTNQIIDYSFESEKGETQSVHSILEDVVSLFPDENSGLIMKKELPSWSSSIGVNSFHGGKEEIENSSGNDLELSLKSVGGVILQTLSAIFYDCNQSPEYQSAEEDIDISAMANLELESHVDVSSDSPSSVTEVDSASKMTNETRSRSLLREENEQKIDTHPLQSVNLSMAARELSDTDNECVNKENQTPEDLPASNPQCEEGNIGSTAENQQLNEPLNLQNSNDDTSAVEETEDRSTLMKEVILTEATIDDLAATEVLEELEYISPIMEEVILREITIDDPAAIEVLEGAEYQSPSMEEVILREITIDDDAATEVLKELEYISPIMEEVIPREITIDDPAAIELLEETEYPSPLIEVILREEAIDSPAAIGVLGEAEDQSPLRKESILREPTIDSPAAIGVLEAIEDQSPLRKERILSEPTTDAAATEAHEESEYISPIKEEVILREITIDDPAAIELLEETEYPSPLMEEVILREEAIDSPAAIGVLGEAEDQSASRKESIVREAATIDSPAAIGVLGETEVQSPLRKEGILNEPTIDDPAAIEVLEAIEDQSPLRKELSEPTIDDPSAIEAFGETENKSPSMKEEGILREPTIVSIVHLETEESQNSSMPRGEVLPQSKQSQTPESNFPEIENSENIMGSFERSEKRTGSCNIWSRRGKPASALQLQTSRSQRKTKRDEETYGAADRENQENVDECKSIRKSLFSDLEEVYTSDKENCTPYKENYTPNTSILRSKKKATIELEDNMTTSSDKENQTPQILRELKSARFSRHNFKLDQDIVLKERKAERVPLQSLISNSPVRLSDVSSPSASKRSSSSVSCNQKKVTNSDSINSIRDGRRRWTMIADTTSLLNKETRHVLHLLQGLKGTHLIIPWIVIRELDSLNRCNSLFRRKTEASVVLQWIEESMVKTKWWIHVQSSVEEVRPIAPTPPATPVSQFREGSEFFPFSAHGTPRELVSPTAEDHILDCALFYRKMNNDRQLALLSNNVTLKIKAMAEGLLCETAQEFRDSLVNPFSARFLWADSSPRGQTWSVCDDVVLKEKYYRSPSKKSSKGEGAKGLKLILLHNSHYIKTI